MTLEDFERKLTNEEKFLLTNTFHYNLKEIDKKFELCYDIAYEIAKNHYLTINNAVKILSKLPAEYANQILFIAYYIDNNEKNFIQEVEDCLSAVYFEYFKSVRKKDNKLFSYTKNDMDKYISGKKRIVDLYEISTDAMSCGMYKVTDLAGLSSYKGDDEDLKVLSENRRKFKHATTYKVFSEIMDKAIVGLLQGALSSLNQLSV